MENYVLQLEQIKKTYGELDVLQDINLKVKKGEFVTILGPSGSGKSTIFRIITGLTDADQGKVLFDYADGTDKDALSGKAGSGIKNTSVIQNTSGIQNTPESCSQRPGVIAYMPQKDTLLPWKTMIDNIALPLLIKGAEKKVAYDEVRKMLPAFGLEGFESYYPSQLSGGMKQRAALMRTFLTDSPLMLLDEPFASLDAITRTDLQEWLLGVWQQFDKSVLFITHSIEEAIYLSDTVYVLSNQPGQLVLSLPIAIGRPRDTQVLTSKAFNEYRDILYKTLREQR